MRNKGALQALCLIFPVFIMSMVSFPLYTNGLYEHWDAETNSFLYCKEVPVKRGYEVVPCRENEAEDSVRKCPVGQYQPDQTNSSSSPQCIVEPECTEEGIKKNVTCIDEYCWTVCICNLEVGKCGQDPSNCLDVKDIKCMGKVLQDCSCALPDIPTQLPTSPPTRSILSTTLKPINPDWTAKTALSISTDKRLTWWKRSKLCSSKGRIYLDVECTHNSLGKMTCDYRFRITNCVAKWPGSVHDSRKFLESQLCTAFENGEHDGFLLGDSGYPYTTKITNKTGVTKDGTDTGAKGNEVGYLFPVIIIIIVLVILVVLYIIYVHKRCSNRPKEVNKESIEMLESNPADKNIGDKVSEGTDSGVCGLSKGSHENLEPGETNSNSINVSNGSEMESGRNINNSIRDDRDAGRGQSLSQVEVHKDSKPRVEPTFNLAEEGDRCLESDPFLSPNGCADNPGISDSSQQSDENCEPGKTNTNNILTNGLDDPDMTSCKWTSCSGTNRHHTDADHGTDPDSTPSLCQLDVQKNSRQREKPIIVDKEMVDSSVEITSLQAKKVAVVSPFNEVQIVPVEDSPAGMNAENQPLRGEGYSSHSEGVTAVNLSMDWITLGRSIYHDNTNQQDD